MKSRIKITIAAIGLVSSVIISAVAGPTSEKIVAVDYLVNTGASEQVFEKEQVVSQGMSQMENAFMLIELEGDNKKVDASFETSSKSVSQSSSSSSKPNSSTNSSSSKNNSSQSASASEAPSSNQSSSQQPSSTADGKVDNAFAPAFVFPSTPVVAPTVREGAGVSPYARDESGNEILWVNGQKLEVKEALKRIVSNEVNSFNYEAIKAQVVASHTYVKYYNDKGGSASVGMKSSYTKGGAVDRAVEEVYNEIMTYNGRAIYSPYHACSSGKTEASKNVWGGSLAWLVSVDSRYDYLADYYNLSKKIYASSPINSNYKRNKTISEQEVKKIIQNKLGVTPTGSPETWFEFLSPENNGTTSGGYVNKIKVAGKTTTGVKCRGYFNLRSASFTVNYKNGNFVFTTQGYGHGVGMSQWGAHFYADKEGWSYKQILSHYYSGISISKIV